ncbi:MAG: NnrS family protein, partial [Alphaproteobacteria bacterium]
WHVHEMLFGYGLAVIAGFLLTAIPNWTGRLPVAGFPLVALVVFWLAGRVAVAFSMPLGVAASVIDILFPVALSFVAFREVLAGRNWRNLPICILVAILALASILSQFGDALPGGAATAHRFTIAGIATLIGLVGGRVTPSFTRNWLVKQGHSRLPAAFGAFDKGAVALLGVAIFGWAAWPDATVVGWLLWGAGVLNLARVARWCGWATFAEPLVLVLHVGYSWLPIGMLLLGGAILVPGTFEASPAVHALTAGAVGTMTMAVMTRATLGHTGRLLTAGPATVAIFVLIVVGAILRVTLPWLPVDHMVGATTAGMLWSAGFLLFVAVYGPMLISTHKASA